jgi:hypothetical protein
MFASGAPQRTPGALWLEPGHGAIRRGRHGGRRARRRPPVGWLLLVLILAGAGGAAALVIRHRDQVDRERAIARAYTQAWAARDARAMWNTLDAASRSAHPLPKFTGLLRSADRAATVTAVKVATPAAPHDHAVGVPVALTTRLFGTLRGTVTLPITGDGHVAWSPSLRLPGLRAGERPRRRILRHSHRAGVLTADGHVLAADPVLAPFHAGLARRYKQRLAGRPGAELRFGSRMIAEVAPEAGRSVTSTMRRSVQAAAQQALGGRLGGVAVLRPKDGSVLALAGIADSAPQPPGSTFKIITLSAALSAGIAKPSTVFPVRTGVTLSGRRLANASNESCGGTLAASFAKSCNSVFAPLGARVGARRLVAQARAFGFNAQPRVPVAKPSTIPDASELRDALAVGASAIGQNKDLATPLGMAGVAAAIGQHGVRADPRVVRSDPVERQRAVSRRIAATVRDMMIGVVRSGTGTAAALPGVQVAGKTGTAELRFTGGAATDPKNTDAWFVAFAPARRPRVAVAVMLVGAGAGGKAAAPIARQVLAAALA